MATIEETTELPLNLHEYEAAARDLLSPMTSAMSAVVPATR